MAARFLTMQDVADELAVSMSQVYHMVRSGELPAIKIGGRGQWRIERARLEEYITLKVRRNRRFRPRQPAHRLPKRLGGQPPRAFRLLAPGKPGGLWFRPNGGLSPEKANVGKRRVLRSLLPIG